MRLKIESRDGWMKRVAIILAVSILLAVPSIQLVTAQGPLSPEQLRIYKSGIQYFDIKEATIRTSGGSSSEGGEGGDGPSEGGGSTGNVDPIDLDNFDNSILNAIQNAWNMESPGNCVNLPKNFINNYTTLAFGSWNGGGVAQKTAEKNPGKGKYVARSATSLNITGPAVGIFSTYAEGMVVAVCHDSLSPTSGPSAGKCGHTGIIVVYSDGRSVLYDSSFTSGPESPDNRIFDRLFNTNSFSSFYWIDQKDLRAL